MSTHFALILMFLVWRFAHGLYIEDEINSSELEPTNTDSSGRTAYIVEFEDGIDAQSEIATACDEENVEQVFGTVLNGALVSFTPEELDTFKQKSHVKSVTPDHIVKIAGFDRVDGSRWGLDRIDQALLPLNQRYYYFDRSRPVHVFVLDTGIYLRHEEFEYSRAESGHMNFIPEEMDSNPSIGFGDCHGHGTHVASTIGGKSVGVARNVLLHSMRVLGCDGSGRYSYIIKALQEIVDYCFDKICVANLSLGGPRSDTFNGAIDNAVMNGVAVVVAAGNSNADASNFSPASAALAITVGASNKTDGRASFSNFGPDVDIFAPGSLIKGAWIGSPTATAILSGTSMASPHVAGIVALMLVGVTPSEPEQVLSDLLRDSTCRITNTTDTPNNLALLPSANRDGDTHCILQCGLTKVACNNREDCCSRKCKRNKKTNERLCRSPYQVDGSTCFKRGSHCVDNSYCCSGKCNKKNRCK